MPELSTKDIAETMIHLFENAEINLRNDRVNLNGLHFKKEGYNLKKKNTLDYLAYLKQGLIDYTRGS